MTERRKPLKRTPLKRTPLKRGKPLKARSTLKPRKKTEPAEKRVPKEQKPRKRLKQRSAKQEKVYELRRPLVAKMLAERPWCEACAVFAAHDGKVVFTKRKSVDVHELVRRSPSGSILDEANCMTVCRPCHRRIGEYPQLAIDLGLAKRGYERG